VHTGDVPAGGNLAKTFATLDVLSGGRAFCGLGAGWWRREHEAFGLPFPAIAERLDQVETTIETMRALWSRGTKAYDGERVQLPETTCYPRPVGDIPIIVGGSGEHLTLRLVARLADGCNLPSDAETLAHKRAVLRRHCEEVGRNPDDVAVTVLDLPVIGNDRDDTWARVERLRGPTAAAVFARRHNAGTIDEHRRRLDRLRMGGVETVFMAPPDLTGPEDVLRLSALAQ
jgi:alkanesulfonate monooxygenase SsuD/methylene tetrahydromethanopterin reductase-like flavin-dependent oxidoreductase (luciferase family)